MSKIFEASNVQSSRAYSYNQNRGEYLKIDWLGRPIYWQKDEESGEARYNGRLDERAQYLYHNFLAERNNHKYRIDYAIAAEKIETDYAKFYEQLGRFSLQAVFWKIQALSSKLFSFFKGASKKDKDHKFFYSAIGLHSPFYHATLTSKFKISELEAAGVFKLEPGNAVKDFTRFTVYSNINPYNRYPSIRHYTDNTCFIASYLPLKKNEKEKSIKLEFSYDIWRKHAENKLPTILRTYSSNLLDTVFYLNGCEGDLEYISEQEAKKYIRHFCCEAGLADYHESDMPLFNEYSPIRLKPDITVTQLQVASLCILGHLQRNTEAQPRFMSQLDDSVLRKLSRNIAALTDQEIADLKRALIHPENPYSINLSEIVQDIQAQAKILQNNRYFIKKFSEFVKASVSPT